MKRTKTGRTELSPLFDKYFPTTSQIEAYGVKGMDSKPWRKTFKSMAAFEAWVEQNAGNITLGGYRKVETSR